MINNFINIFMYVLFGWLIVNVLYMIGKNTLEKKGLKLYYGFILVYKKPYGFKNFLGNSILRKIFYVMILASVYGVYIYYSTMIANILAKTGLITLPTKPRVLIPGINITGIDLLYFALSILIAALIHEVSHALAAVSNKIKVNGLGFAIIFFIPIAFTEIDEKHFNENPRKAKVTVLSAGPAANIVLAIIAVFILSIMISSTGLVIIGVEEDSLASKYGLKENSVILEINGKPATLKMLTELLHRNETITITFKILEPDGKISTIDIVKPANITRLGVLLTFMPSMSLISILGIQGSLALVSIVRWIYIVNMSLGIINIAPLFITDGARILEELTRNNKVVNGISIVTLLLLLTLFIP